MKVFEPECLLDDDPVWVIPMHNFSKTHPSFLVARGILYSGLLLVLITSGPSRWFLNSTVSFLCLLAIVMVWSFWSRVEYTEIDFATGKVRRHYFLSSLRKPSEVHLGDFNSVMGRWSSSRFGPHWLSVMLSGNKGTVEVARFSPDGNSVISLGGSMLDPVDAIALRKKLAERAVFRNIGVV